MDAARFALITVMARVINPKNKLVAMTAAGPPGAHRAIFDLPEYGGLRARNGDGSTRAKLPKLPFAGATYVKFALVRSVKCVYQRCIRLSVSNSWLTL